MVTNKIITYPIFTFRWLAVHALAIPTVFFVWVLYLLNFLINEKDILFLKLLS